jgi:hypothetical protein
MVEIEAHCLPGAAGFGEKKVNRPHAKDAKDAKGEKTSLIITHWSFAIEHFKGAPRTSVFNDQCPMLNE